MKKFFAKSDPLETIEEHTSRLEENFRLLKSMGYLSRYDDRMLELALRYHDVGKIGQGFQNHFKSKEEKDPRFIGEKNIPHAYLSAALLPRELLKEKGFDKLDQKIIINSIIYHHDRAFEPQGEHFELAVEALKKEVASFDFVPLAKPERVKFPKGLYVPDRISKEYLWGWIENAFQETLEEDELEAKVLEKYRNHVLTKGLLHRLDYAASAHEKVEYPADFLEEALEKYRENVLQVSRWNDLQNYMIKHRDENVIAVAQTGFGKTEAALLWIGNNKGFFTLPIRVALNDIYGRISEKIVVEKIEERVGLNHSESFGEYIERKNGIEEGLERYYDRTKLMSLPLTLSTLDQLFTFVFAYRGYEHKLATLTYSKLVIDEIQMYSPELLAYLIVGLKKITELGGKFSIITATFPPLIKDLLQEQGIDFVRSPNFIRDGELRHSIKVIEDTISSDFIIHQSKQHPKVLVICNTIRTAQELYEEASRKLKESGEDMPIHLLHSLFTKGDRRKKELDILRLGKKGSSGCGIWIGTQVLEASLDIDFDVLITELSDVNGFFQRLGRVYRNRALEETKAYNSYLFVGSKEKKIRGVGHIIDPEIFKKSREALLEYDGRLSEQKKIEIVDQVYTKENLEGTLYLQNIESNVDYRSGAFENMYSKKEAAQKFRDIYTYNIIPSGVYEENKEQLEKLIKQINGKSDALQRARDKARLAEFIIPIQSVYFKKHFEKTRFDLGRYDSVVIYDCEYSFERGFSQKTISHLKADDEADRFF